MCLISHALACKPESKLLETDGDRLEWVPYMPGAMVKEYPVLSRNVPLGTETYCTPEQE